MELAFGLEGIVSETVDGSPLPTVSVLLALHVELLRRSAGPVDDAL